MKLYELIKEQLEDDFQQLSEDKKMTIMAQFQAIKLFGEYSFDFHSIYRAAFKNRFYELLNFMNNSKRFQQILKNYKAYLKKINNSQKYKRLFRIYSLS